MTEIQLAVITACLSNVRLRVTCAVNNLPWVVSARATHQLRLHASSLGEMSSGRA